MSTLLLELLNQPLKSVEILDIPQHELTDGHLAVPRRALYAAYLEAISSNTLDESTTKIILLTNPAHQTALNARKNLIQQGSLDPSHDLQFIAAVLSTRDGSKQSILWHHRRWLLSRLYETAIPPDIVRVELSLVAQACELYPRNYHAWTHRTFLFDSLSHPDIVSDEVRHARRWLELHVSDHSAVHYLSHISSTSSLPHALSLATAYPNHESLWAYLRYASREDRSDPDLLAFADTLARPWANNTALPPLVLHPDIISRQALLFLANKPLLDLAHAGDEGPARRLFTASPSLTNEISHHWGFDQ